jgi:heme/copper-type cytochrome/quinol oxidase subunit 2
MRHQPGYFQPMTEALSIGCMVVVVVVVVVVLFVVVASLRKKKENQISKVNRK